MPLQEMMRALAGTPPGDTQAIAVLSWAAGRWHLMQGKQREAERLLRRALEVAPDLRPVMRLLASIQEDKRDVRALVQFVDLEIRATRHPREAAALYRERGRVVESQFGDLEAAAECYRAALNAAGSDLATLRSSERISLAQGDVPGLVENLGQQVTALSEPLSHGPLLHELALLHLHRGSDAAVAVDLLVKTLELFPGHPVAAVDLLRASELTQNSDTAVYALDQMASGIGPHGRALAMARAAAVMREAGDRSEALPLLRAAAATAASNLSLWQSLHEHALACGAYETAVDAALRIARLIDTDEPTARAEALYRAGKLAVERTDQVDVGIQALMKALREDPGHLPSLEEAARLLSRQGRHAQLLEMLERYAAAAPSLGLTRAEIAGAHLRVGQVLERHLSRPEAALRAYGQAVDVAPDFRPAKDAIERLLHLQSDHRGLLKFYQEELEHADDEKRTIYLRGLLGQLASRLDDKPLATKHFVALLKQSPDHMSSLQSLARLLAKQGRTRDLLKITEREASLTQSAGRKAALQHRCGELYLEEGEPAKARACFEAAVDTLDDFTPALNALDDVLREAGDHAARVELLQRKLLYAPDRHSRATLQMEIARLMATELDRPEDALDLLEVMLNRWPDHLPALHMAARLAEQLGQWQRLVALLESHTLATRSARSRALLLHRSAMIHATYLDDDERACRLLSRALTFWPELGVARTRLLQLYEKLGRSRELRSLAESAIDQERSEEARQALALQLAELSPHVEVAMQYLEPVAQARPRDFVTQQRLARAALYARQNAQEAEARARMADIIAEEAPPDTQEVMAQRYLAGVAWEREKQLDAADEIYARILDEDPSFVVATRGRLRIKALRSELAAPVPNAALRASDNASDFEAAALENIAAEIMERRGQYDQALEHLQRARAHAPDLLSALHTEARVLARKGDTAGIIRAISLEERIAAHASTPTHRARALVRAGRLALRRVAQGEPATESWRLFSEALASDPGNDDAARWLMQVLTEHGVDGAPPLHESLLQRVECICDREDPDPTQIQMAGRLAVMTAGPAKAIALFERAVARGMQAQTFAAELANLYAQVESWDLACDSLRLLLGDAPPERTAAVHFYLAQMERARGRWEAAFASFMTAGAGGFYPVHAFTEAEALAEANNDNARLVEALERRVEAIPGAHRPQLLRKLARLYGDTLGDSKQAIMLLRRVVAAESGDLEAIRDLHRRLESAGQTQEANATLMGAIAHHRALIRSEAFTLEAHALDTVARLVLLYRLARNDDGIYLATGLREVLSHTPEARERLPSTCDDLRTTPWHLPSQMGGRGLEGLLGDLPNAAVIDLLHEASFTEHEAVPDLAPPAVPGGPPLPPANGAVSVVTQLAESLGVPVPILYLDPAIQGVEIRSAKSLALCIGKDVQATPSRPDHRAAFGRALFTLAVGGPQVRHGMDPSQRISFVAGLIEAAELSRPAALGTELDDEVIHATVTQFEGVAGSLVDAASALVASLEGPVTISPEHLTQTLEAAEDRVALLCAADPRPVLSHLMSLDALHRARGRLALGFLFSDEHLRLRDAWGYLAEATTDTEDAP